MILLAAGFFMRSFNSAQAGRQSPDGFQQKGTNIAGKYQACLVIDGTAYNALIIDTETGKSAFYSGCLNAKWQLSPNQLPSNPLGN
ncbi:MAG: hypothetical protein C0408_09515 [Odoribacter sp.]|nr:hypothetical protein [Odoribacter sp.]